VGAVDAGIGAARAIADQAPAVVIFVGTAGSYPSSPARRKGALTLAVGEVTVARNLFLLSSAVLSGQAYAPAPLVDEVASDPRLVRALCQQGAIVPRDVGCPLGITRAEALARRIARETGAAVENLEAFAVARAAALAGVPFAAVLGIANRVGPGAHAEWKANHHAASRAACALVQGWLRGQIRDRPGSAV
jgi:purine-nucleoside phosphorylase